MNPASDSALITAVNRPIKGALSRLFNKRLRIAIGERDLSFKHPSDFEFALGGRVSVSLVKLVELLHRSANSLRREGLFVKLMEHQLMRTLERCRREPESIGALLREVGLKSFSTDYHWRTIFEALAAGGPELNEYRRIALVKYLQYLGARRDALNIIYFHKTRKALDEDHEILVEAPATTAASSAQSCGPVHFLAAGQHTATYERLPRGKSVAIHMHPTGSIDLVLAQHRFNLQGGEQYALVDELGRRHPLAPRKNSIGRGLGNDITLDRAFRSVSRRHVTIEPLADGRVRLIDLSALGTFVPAGCVEAA